MNVLSLFDGISGAQVALRRLDANCENYFASEIDKFAIRVTQHNFPNTVQLGDVNNWKEWALPKIDVLIAGSPCQGFSSSGKGLNFNDPRSALFFKFVEVKNHLLKINPNLKFVLENVKMKKEWASVITDYMGVDPVLINSSLVSAQNRNRLYWCNFPVTQPEDKHIYLKDIIENGSVNRNKSYCIDANYYKGGSLTQYLKKKRRQIDYLPQSARRIMVKVNGHGFVPTYETAVEKSHTLRNATNGNYWIKADDEYRKLTPLECERLQTFTEDEKSVIIDLCLDLQNNYANAEIQCHKLPSLAGNVEKLDSRENAQFVQSNLSTKNLQTEELVHYDVLISCEERKIVLSNQEKLLLTVNTAEKGSQFHPLVTSEDFVRLVASINQIAEKTMLFGKAELHQNVQCLTLQSYGKSAVSLSGKEIMQLVKDVEKDLTTHKKRLRYITSNLTGQEKNEQTLKILFSYVLSAIIGYIPQEMLNQSILRFQLNSKIGYTNHISNTQRYKSLGNSFTVDVIVHILKCMLDQKLS